MILPILMICHMCSIGPARFSLTDHFTFRLRAFIWPCTFPFASGLRTHRVTVFRFATLNLTTGGAANCFAFWAVPCSTPVLWANDEAVRLTAGLLAEADVHFWTARLAEGRRTKRLTRHLTDRVSAGPPAFWSAARGVTFMAFAAHVAAHPSLFEVTSGHLRCLSHPELCTLHPPLKQRGSFHIAQCSNEQPPAQLAQHDCHMINNLRLQRSP